MSAEPLHTLRGTETVLVVDDTDLFLDVVVRLLEGLGYTVLSAGDGPSALVELERRGGADVLLTDVRMPGMSGPALADAVHRRWPACSVLFMTGYGDHHLEGRPRDRILEKPFSHASLARRLRDLLD